MHNSRRLELYHTPKILYGLANSGDRFNEPIGEAIPTSLGTCKMQDTLLLIIGIDLIYLNNVSVITF